MNRLILIGILWSLTIAIGSSQETLSGSRSIPQTPPVYGIPTTATPIGMPGPPRLPRTEIPAVADRIAQLRTDYEVANKQVYDLAESLRQTPDASKKAELRTAVQRAFTLRQRLLRAELQEMQARLEKTQQSLDMRDRIVDQIVDRRVEDLLNPQLKWEGSPQSTRGEQSSPAERPSTAVPRPSTPPVPTEPVAEVSDVPQLDQTQKGLLEKLQGFWDIEERTLAAFEPDPDNSITTWEISGKDIFLHGVRPDKHLADTREKELVYHLELGPPDGLQEINLTRFDGALLQGIISTTDDVVRICIRHGRKVGEFMERPKVFAVTEYTDMLELRRRPTPVTELEGDWHWVSGTDSLGKAIEVSPYNVSFKSDKCTIAFQGGQFDRRVRVDPDSTRIFGFMDNRAFLADNYRIEGDQLTLSGDGVTMVYQRGHTARPKSIPNATEEQKSRWRSGIVDIYWEHHTPAEMRQDPVGKGVVISPTGMVICQVPEEIQSERDSKTKFIVRFDDGGFAYTTIVEEADHGWIALQPTQPGNHQFQVSTLPMSVGDQVHLWACAPGGPPSRITVDLAKVILLDRQATTANTSVCQLTRPSDFRAESCPVLSGDGELLAITLRGTGDLVLAVPVAELKTMFPKSFGPAAQVSE